MTYDDMLAPLDAGGTTTVAPAWGQGRATFGGLVAALLYRRAAAVLAARGEDLAGKSPRSLTFSLVAPVAPGEVDVTVDVLRSGKSVTQVEARLVQEGQVAAVMLASFGSARESAIKVAAEPPLAFPLPSMLSALPYIAGTTPEFTQHFEFRWAVGKLPFMPPPALTGDMGGYVRFRHPVARTGVDTLLGLVDAWPPAVLPMFTRPAPISTLAWTIELPGHAAPTLAALPGDVALQYLAQTDFSGDGYAHIRSRTHAPDGTLLAIGRQTVAIFA